LLDVGICKHHRKISNNYLLVKLIILYNIYKDRSHVQNSIKLKLFDIPNDCFKELQVNIAHIIHSTKIPIKSSLIIFDCGDKSFILMLYKYRKLKPHIVKSYSTDI